MCFSSGIAKVLDPGGFIAEKTTPKAFAPYSGLHGTSKAMRDLQTGISDAVIVAPLVARIRRRPPGRRHDQAALDHARQRPVHRADVRHRIVATGFDVADDAVPMALAGGEADEDVKFHRPQRGEALFERAAWPIGAHLSLAWMHGAYMRHACSLHPGSRAGNSPQPAAACHIQAVLI